MPLTPNPSPRKRGEGSPGDRLTAQLNRGYGYHGGMAKRVVIVGGGFGGLAAARAFARQGAEVTVLDRRNFHLFQPLLYQVATGGLSPGDISSPIRSVFRRRKNVRVLMAEATGLDAERRVLSTDGGDLPYDILVIATGVRHSYFGRDEWEAVAPGLKTIEQGLQIRRKVLSAFERAEACTDPESQRRALTFLVVGAGPTGVELAGAVGELTRRTLRGEYRSIDPAQASIYLVEAGERILPTFSPALSRRAERSLARLGVSILTRHRVTHIEEGRGTLADEGGTREIFADNIFWAAGVEATAFGRIVAETLSAETDRAGRLAVTRDLHLPDHPDIFVIGDLAAFPEPMPGVAQVAMQMGRHCAEVVRRQGQSTSWFRYRDLGSLAVIGRNAAVGEVFGVKVWGWMGWLIWSVIHLMQLVEFENRILVATQWLFNYVTFKRGARLIGNDDASSIRDY